MGDQTPPRYAWPTREYTGPDPLYMEMDDEFFIEDQHRQIKRLQDFLGKINLIPAYFSLIAQRYTANDKDGYEEGVIALKEHMGANTLRRALLYLLKMLVNSQGYAVQNYGLFRVRSRNSQQDDKELLLGGNDYHYGRALWQTITKDIYLRQINLSTNLKVLAKAITAVWMNASHSWFRGIMRGFVKTYVNSLPESTTMKADFPDLMKIEISPPPHNERFVIHFK